VVLRVERGGAMNTAPSPKKTKLVGRSTATPQNFLEAERDRLWALVDQINHSGPVAPRGVWLEESPVRSRAGKEYPYWRVCGAIRATRVGRIGSSKYNHWFRSIRRRRYLDEIDTQLRLVDELIERQRSHPMGGVGNGL
jgi:hypothetical protein